MLMAACIRAGSPSRIGRTFLLDRRRLDVSHFDVKPLELWYFEQAVHELGRSPIHFDMESLNLAREVVKGDDGRNCDEDTHRRRDQGLSDAARNHRHSAGPCGRDAPESVDDSDHSAEKTNERGRGADCGKEPETLIQLKRGLGFLATIGSTAPFVGLFGTVVGIINAFRSIAATGSGGMSVVSGGIAEALVSTAM